MSKLLHKAIREKSDNAYTIYQQHLASRPVNVSGAYRHLAGGQPVEFFVITLVYHIFYAAGSSRSCRTKE